MKTEIKWNLEILWNIVFAGRRDGCTYSRKRKIKRMRNSSHLPGSYKREMGISSNKDGKQNWDFFQMTKGKPLEKEKELYVLGISYWGWSVASFKSNAVEKARRWSSMVAYISNTRKWSFQISYARCCLPKFYLNKLIFCAQLDFLHSHVYL